jgi:hypothetical protein
VVVVVQVALVEVQRVAGTIVVEAVRVVIEATSHPL